MFNNKVIFADRLVATNVDLQNCFGPNGEVPVAGGDEVVPPLNKVNRYTRSNGGVVVASRDWHENVTPEESEHFQIFGVHGVAGTFGAEFLEGFELEQGDVILSKGQDPAFPGFSAFEGVADDGRTLEGIVRPRRNETVVMTVGGLATEYCDEATAMGGVQLREKCTKYGGRLIIVAILDAMRAVNIKPTDEEESLQRMRDAGVIMMTSEEIVNGAIKLV